MSKQFGDFQTPPALVKAVLECLGVNGQKWPRVLEPTCGCGNFIAGLLNLSVAPREIQAIELQNSYIKEARTIIKKYLSTSVIIKQGQLFEMNLLRDLHWSETGSLLVIGNPPWVTNSTLGALAGNNLPRKRNIKRLKGIDAITGSANFDIAEYIWIKLIKELYPEKPAIALLCKTSVARNVLQFAFDEKLPISNASLRLIDTKKWFCATVSACLFYIEVGTEKPQYEATVYRDLYTTDPDFTIGIVGSKLIADIQAYQHSAFADGICPLTWRQGLKHDAASVMELTYNSLGNLQNKLGETVVVESEYIYPLLKSTDLFKNTRSQNKFVIVTQKRLNEDTYHLQQKAQKLWNYLTKHAEIFERRKSSVYRGKPPFSMFGIGEYSFAPYKVGISGLHKLPKFRAIAPIGGRPVMLDDTCYFIPCYSPEQAAFLASILNTSLCLNVINSRMFTDAKRPITKKLLQSIDLKALLNKIEIQVVLREAEVEFKKLTNTTSKPAWPSSLEELLIK